MARGRRHWSSISSTCEAKGGAQDGPVPCWATDEKAIGSLLIRHQPRTSGSEPVAAVDPMRLAGLFETTEIRAFNWTFGKPRVGWPICCSRSQPLQMVLGDAEGPKVTLCATGDGTPQLQAPQQNMRAMKLRRQGLLLPSNEGLEVVRHHRESAASSIPTPTIDDPRWECRRTSAVCDMPKPVTPSRDRQGQSEAQRDEPGHLDAALVQAGDRSRISRRSAAWAISTIRRAVARVTVFCAWGNDHRNPGPPVRGIASRVLVKGALKTRSESFIAPNTPLSAPPCCPEIRKNCISFRNEAHQLWPQDRGRLRGALGLPPPSGLSPGRAARAWRGILIDTPHLVAGQNRGLDFASGSGLVAIAASLAWLRPGSPPPISTPGPRPHRGLTRHRERLGLRVSPNRTLSARYEGLGPCGWPATCSMTLPWPTGLAMVPPPCRGAARLVLVGGPAAGPIARGRGLSFSPPTWCPSRVRWKNSVNSSAPSVWGCHRISRKELPIDLYIRFCIYNPD